MQTPDRYAIMTEKSVLARALPALRSGAGKERVMEKMEELLHILEKNARLPLEDIAAMMDVPAAEAAALMDEAKERDTSAVTRRWWTGKEPVSIRWRP